MPQVFYRCTRHLPRFQHVALVLGLVLVVVLARSSVALGQAPEPEWTVSVGTPGFDEVLGISALPSGVLVVGSTAGAFPFNQNLGGNDAFVSKYDAEGNSTWTRQFGTGGTDRASSVAADDAAIYIAGSTTGAFGGQTNSGDNLDAFIRKANPQGFDVWTRQFGTLGSDQARAVALDSSGVYVTGVVGGVAAGYSPSSGTDAFVRKYDFDGNLVWEHQFGTAGSEDAFGIAVQPSGIYVAGTTTSTFPDQEYVGGDTDVFVRKYDLEGAEVWTRQLGTLGSDQVAGLVSGPSGIYIVGTSTGAFAGQSNFGGSSDTFLISYNFDGNQRWVRQYGTEGRDEATDVAIVGSNIIVTGSTSAALPGYRNVGENLDAILLKYNPRGNRNWARQTGTPGVDRPFGVAAHLQRVYMAGNTEGSFPRESDGFITSFIIADSGEAEVTPVAPQPAPEPTVAPLPTTTPSSTPDPTPLSTPAATPTTAPSPTPSPVPSPTLTPTAAPTPTSGPAAVDSPTPRPTATPRPTPTPRPTLPPLDFSPPDDGGGPGSMRLLLLGLIGLLAIIALIGVVRNW